MLRCMGHRPCIEEWFSPGDLDSVLGDSVEELENFGKYICIKSCWGRTTVKMMKMFVHVKTC